MLGMVMIDSESESALTLAHSYVGANAVTFVLNNP